MQDGVKLYDVLALINAVRIGGFREHAKALELLAQKSFDHQ
jgi:hypothetical protein